MMPMLWKWFRQNFTLALSLSGVVCLALALEKVLRGATWSLLIPVSLAAVMCGWGLGSSQLNTKQAWASLVGLGIPWVFLFASGLVSPLGQLAMAMLALVPQLISWITERTLVDIGPMLVTWIHVSTQAASVLARFWTWLAALASGESSTDPLAVLVAWNLILWLVGAWSAWQLRRNRQALSALAPGGALLALVVDYTHGEIGLVIVYLGILLVLMGVVRNEWRLTHWQRRKVDYSDSVVFETLIMVTVVAAGLVASAAFTPSLSWRELLEKLRQSDRSAEDQVAQSLGLEAPPNVANEPAYRSGGLPRQHLLDYPPEQLKDVVLVVSTGELPPIPYAAEEIPVHRYYWRAVTFDRYTGAGWSSSPAQEVEYSDNAPLLELPQNYRILNQTIERAGDESSYVYWTGILAQANAEMKIAWRTEPPADPAPASNGDILGATTPQDEYTVISYISEITAEQLRTAGSSYPEAIIRRYLRLPESVPERVLRQAREVTQAALTPYDRAVAIETYLRSFPYTLEVERPPSGRDVVDYFLFTAQQGYCDYYATAMVVLARAAGLPARIVVGYTSGEYDFQSAKYIIRKENAHSWVDVYFDGVGWVEFEPTAGQPAIGRMDNNTASLPLPKLSPGKLALSWLKTGWAALASSLGGQLLIAGVGLILLLFLWQAGEVWFLRLLPARRAISRMYSRMELASSRLLPGLPNGHTPHQLQIALAQKLKGAKTRWRRALFIRMECEIEQIVALYVAQSFSEHPPSKSQTGKGIHAWTRLRWRLWIASRWLR